MVASVRVFKGRVLAVASDEELSSYLGRALGNVGYDVSFAVSARNGVTKALESTPDLVVCDIYLSDMEGAWLAERLRAERGRVALTPIILLADRVDVEAAERGLLAGGDVALYRPFTEIELCNQADSITRMARRYQERRDSVIPMSAKAPPALRGDLEQMSLATVLMIIEMERRSGRLNITTANEAQKAVFSLAQGTFVIAMLDGRPYDSLSALQLALGWEKGRFWFVPSATADEPNPQGAIGGMLLEATRRLDEQAR